MDLMQKVDNYIDNVTRATGRRSVIDLETALDMIIGDQIPAFVKAETVGVALHDTVACDWSDGFRVVVKKYRRHIKPELVVPLLIAAIKVAALGVVREWANCFAGVKLDEKEQQYVADAVRRDVEIFDAVKKFLGRDALRTLLSRSVDDWNTPMVMALLKAGASYEGYLKDRIDLAVKRLNDADLAEILNALELAREMEITEGAGG